MIQKNLELSYLSPTKEPMTFKIDSKKFFSSDTYGQSKELYKIYESDYLFIPKDVTNMVDYLETEYAFDKIDAAAKSRRALEKSIFGEIQSLVDKVSFTCTKEEAINFFKEVLKEESEALASDELDPTLALIMNSKNKEVHLKKLVIQFAIEFLCEGSGMAHYAGGSYGPLQAGIFRIMLDEMGEGIYDKKHSHLYEGAMSTLGLSDKMNYYADFFDTSTYTVTNFVYYICQNKKFFLRFLGSLLRNEACFINWQKQLGMVMEQVFGKAIDRRYFDVHAVVDQDHGKWSLDTIVNPACDLYGDVVIPEILRGFYEYRLYQDINGLEFCHHVNTYDNLAKTQERQYKTKGLVKTIEQGPKVRFSHHEDTILQPEDAANITIIHDMSTIALTKQNKPYVLPAFFPVWIEPVKGKVTISEIE